MKKQNIFACFENSRFVLLGKHIARKQIFIVDIVFFVKRLVPLGVLMYSKECWLHLAW